MESHNLTMSGTLALHQSSGNLIEGRELPIRICSLVVPRCSVSNQLRRPGLALTAWRRARTQGSTDRPDLATETVINEPKNAGAERELGGHKLQLRAATC